MTDRFSPGDIVIHNADFRCMGRGTGGLIRKGEELVIVSREPADGEYDTERYLISTRKDGVRQVLWEGYLELVITDEVIDNAKQQLDELLGEIHATSEDPL